MSERYCRGCHRPLPWSWPEGPSLGEIAAAMRAGAPVSDLPRRKPGGISMPSCTQVPDDYWKNSVEYPGIKNICANRSWDD